MDSSDASSFRCRSIGCGHVLPLTNRTGRFVLCQECKTVNCLSCRTVHEGRNCISYQKEMCRNASPRQVRPKIKTDELEEKSLRRCSDKLCRGLVLVPVGVSSFECPVCRQKTCIDCGAIHPGISCHHYQLFGTSVKLGDFANELEAAQNADVVKNVEPFRCICNWNVFSGDGVTLKNCHHNICKVCFEDTVRESRNQLVSCPVQERGQPCEGYFAETEIKALVSKEVYDKHNELTLDLEDFGGDSSLYTCAKKGCDETWIKDMTMVVRRCPKCSSLNCIPCNAIHNDMSCLNYIQSVVRKIDKGQDEPEEAKLRRLKELQVLYERDYVENEEEFECTICFTMIAEGDGIILKNCHHQFCRDCLRELVKNSATTVVLCPFRDDDVVCAMEIFDREIKSLLSPEEVLARERRSLLEAKQTARDGVHCKTVDCIGWGFECEDDGTVINQFICPICRKQNCLRCRTIHEGKTCQQYQQELADKAEIDQKAREALQCIQESLASGEAMRCPQCNVVIHKDGGCDALRCANCRLQLCWATKQARWGPKGVGDTSGGCNCNRWNKPCHETCKGCDYPHN